MNCQMASQTPMNGTGSRIHRPASRENSVLSCIASQLSQVHAGNLDHEQAPRHGPPVFSSNRREIQIPRIPAIHRGSNAMR